MFNNYKLLVSDLDGTAIGSHGNAMPTANVINSVSNLQKYMHVACATGRTLRTAKQIINALKLQTPCVVAGGAQIYDPTTDSVIWEQRLSVVQVEQILNIAKNYNYKILYSEGQEVNFDEVINKPLVPASRISLLGVTDADQKIIMDKVAKIIDVSVCTVFSWDAGHTDVYITHAHGTKEYGLKQLLQILNINKSQVIAVGDGNNDIALFKSAGYCVGVQGGDVQLLQLANYVTQPVEQDGLANFINKKLL